MALDPALLEILACPEDKGPLYYIESEDAALQPAPDAPVRRPRRHPGDADRRVDDGRRRRARAPDGRHRGGGADDDLRTRLKRELESDEDTSTVRCPQRWHAVTWLRWAAGAAEGTVGMMSPRQWIARILVVGASDRSLPEPSLPPHRARRRHGRRRGARRRRRVPPADAHPDLRHRGTASTTRLRSVPSRRAAAGPTFDVDILGQVAALPRSAARHRRARRRRQRHRGRADADGYLSIAPTGAAPVSRRSSTSTPAKPSRTSPSSVSAPAARSTISMVTPLGAGSAHVLIDVFGWISTSQFVDAADTGARFDARRSHVGLSTPGRRPFLPAGRADNRSGAMEQLTLPIRGANGVVPNSADVTGVMVNVTAVNNRPGSQPTFLSATPSTTPAGAEPATSVTNVGVGQVKANMAIVPVGDDGSIRIFNRSGSTHVIVDVLGYLEQGAPDTTHDRPRDPARCPVPGVRHPSGRVRQHAARLRDQGGVELPGLRRVGAASVAYRSVAQSALIGNLTGTGLTPLVAGEAVTTYMTVYPGSGATTEQLEHQRRRPGRRCPTCRCSDTDRRAGTRTRSRRTTTTARSTTCSTCTPSSSPTDRRSCPSPVVRRR